MGMVAIKGKGRPYNENVAREPNGRASRRVDDARPSRAHVMRAAAMCPAFSSAAGLAFLARDITQSEFDQAESVAKIVAAYRRAMLIKGVASPSVEGGRASSPGDPDSVEGQAEARRHATAKARFARLSEILVAAGAGRTSLDAERDGQVILNATIRFSTETVIPSEQAEKAKMGLRALSRKKSL